MKTNPSDLIHETEYFKYESETVGTDVRLIKSEPKFGLTKREHFASLAMQGLLANPTLVERIADSEDFLMPAAPHEQAVRMADALIKALNEEQ